MIRPEGSWVAIPTPFTEDDEVDFPGFEKLVDFQAEHGTNGLLLMGSTGESTALTIEERREILDRVLAYAKDRIPVLAGTTCGNTKLTIELSQYAQQAGADGLLLVVPPYLKPTQDGVYEHLKSVAEAVDIPVAIYNNPGRVGVNIEPATVVALAELPNLVADKEAMPNISQLVQIRRQAGDKINLLCCDAPGFSLIVPTLALGGHGTANISGNAIPQEMVEMSRPWLSWEDVQRTRELLFEYYSLMAALYSLPNPIVVKAALRLLGLPAGHVRRPLLDMEERQTQDLRALMDRMGVMDKYGQGKRRA
ncbi:MAG TPA: 4-hydroxy-tetrahydrodipicolinate synthase [Anaerolineae bacterium]|nr:4-hydroxy-tetrahydrodipicolinate synthase [Anaerolineae bacterium]